MVTLLRRPPAAGLDGGIFNTHAEEGFRNSIQGLYTMLVAGVFAIAGNVAAGYLAEIGLITLFRVSVVVCIVGMILIAAGFRLQRRAH